jgi:tripartite-type tricarboxylate transporter receptor subunit TctC
MVNKTGNVRIWIGVFMMGAFLAGLFTPPAEAASAADFYKDKRIIFLVASKAGGGSDLISRIVAPYLKKYTGAYTVIIDNVPEGGGMLALNRLWNSKADGLTICTSIPINTVMMEADKQEGVQYQSDKMNVIFALTTARGNALMVNAKGPYQSVEDLKKARGLKAGGTYGTAMQAAYFADVLGLDVKITPGMSTSDAKMAVMRGEIDFSCDSSGSAYESIQAGDVRPLCIDLSAPISALPKVPSIMKYASLSPQQKEWSSIVELNDMGKYVFTGPNVPRDRIDYLRTVFERIHKDPQFLKDRKKFERLPGGDPWLTGADAQKMFTAYKGNVNKIYAKMVDYLSKKYYTLK